MRKLSFSQAMAEAQLQEMERDPRVFLMGLVLRDPYGGAFGQTKGISSKLGDERIIDAPISELAYIGGGVGAAMAGMRPVVELQFSDFITIGIDQVVQQGANIRYMFGGQISVPMVLRGPAGAYLSAAAQHSHMLESWFAHIPGLKVVLPSDPYDAKGLMTSAIRDNNLVLYFEHKKLYAKKGEVPEEPYEVPIGKAAIKREGSDVTLVTYAYMTQLALEVAEELDKVGVKAEVVDLRTVSPIDYETVLSSVAKTKRAVCIQETYLAASVMSEVAAQINEELFGELAAPTKRIGAKPAPIPFSPPLERHVLPQKEDIEAAVHELLNR